MIIFNFVGLAMLFISFGVAYAVGQLLGTTAEGVLMIIAGPLAVACDVIYRWKHPNGHWGYPSGGGSLFFLPVWLFGIVWFILGISYVVQGRA